MDTSRVIVHSDMNAFYASVEQAERPDLRGLPVVVGGNEDTRHGIVLTASYEAKRRGVKTGTALWEARRACPDAVVVPPREEGLDVMAGQRRRGIALGQQEGRPGRCGCGPG